MLKSNGWKSSFSSSSSIKNGGKKRKHKDYTKRKASRSNQSKRHKCSDSTEHHGQSYETPDSDERLRSLVSMSPLETSLKSPIKSVTDNSKIEKIPEWIEEEDKIMEFQTTVSKSQFLNINVRKFLGLFMRVHHIWVLHNFNYKFRLCKVVKQW